jgi:hypothetical protein
MVILLLGRMIANSNSITSNQNIYTIHNALVFTPLGAFGAMVVAPPLEEQLRSPASDVGMPISTCF